MNGLCMKRRFNEESEFQAPMRKRRYVPNGQIIPVDKAFYNVSNGCFGYPASKQTFELDPAVAQHLHECGILHASGEHSRNNSNYYCAEQPAVVPAGPKADMSMALVVYKRPDLVTPINVNDCDGWEEEEEEKKKRNKNKNKNASVSDAEMAQVPTAATTAPAASSAYSYAYNYCGGYSSSSDSSDMELD